MSSASSEQLVAAAQPIMGGTAPTTAPTQVLTSLRVLESVYGSAYSARFPMPRSIVSSFAPSPRMAALAPALATPQPRAYCGVTRPEGKGRRKVRFMRRSFSRSITCVYVVCVCVGLCYCVVWLGRQGGRSAVYACMHKCLPERPRLKKSAPHLVEGVGGPRRQHRAHRDGREGAPGHGPARRQEARRGGQHHERAVCRVCVSGRLGV